MFVCVSVCKCVCLCVCVSVLGKLPTLGRTLHRPRCASQWTQPGCKNESVAVNTGSSFRLAAARVWVGCWDFLRVWGRCYFDLCLCSVLALNYSLCVLCCRPASWGSTQALFSRFPLPPILKEKTLDVSPESTYVTTSSASHSLWWVTAQLRILSLPPLLVLRGRSLSCSAGKFRPG